MEVYLQGIHAIATLLYLFLSTFTLMVIYAVGRGSTLLPSTQAGLIRFLDKLIQPLLITLGILYFLCFSFKIYWWGTWIFFGICLCLCLVLFRVRQLRQKRKEFLERLSDWKSLIIWDVPLIVYFIYLHWASFGVFYAYDDMQSIFGTQLPR